MTTVVLSDLKASLGEYLARVRGGEELMLIDEGIPVAKIVPIPKCDDEHADLADLIRAGLITPPRKKLSKDFLDRLPRIEDPEGRIRKALQEERDSGW